MEIELLHYTPLEIANKAIGKCWDKPIEMGDKACERIDRVANKHKHGSTIEHLSYTFDIDGISRACLQELARHRHASMSVKSTRYTLKELKDTDKPLEDFVVLTGNKVVDFGIWSQINGVQEALRECVSNDIIKYMLPEAYKTSLVWTVNARALQNFLSLRTDKAALWEIRDLAFEIYNKLPESHKFLFEDYVKWREVE